MPVWMAFCEHFMVISWSWATNAKWVSRVSVCSSTRGSDQTPSEAIFTSCPVGGQGLCQCGKSVTTGSSPPGA